MKKILPILLSLILSAAVVFGLPLIMPENNGIFAYSRSNEATILPQKIEGYTDTEKVSYKLYNSGRLVGVIHDIDEINAAIDAEYDKYKEEFPNTKLGLKEDLYIAAEKSYVLFEDIDDEIIDYLIEGERLGVEVTAIEFSTNDGVYDIIYVKDMEDFTKARDEFILNFISEETLEALRHGEDIGDPVDFGTVEKSIRINETMNAEKAVASPEVIFSSEEEIFEYLCYGRNTARSYYTVEEGDTLQAVGNRNGDMSPRQIVMLNKDVLSSVDQILVPGMQLNTTYYTSPITVTVVKEKLTQEAVTPASPIYKEDDTLAAGKTEIITPEVFGLNNVMYEETWVNGVLMKGEAVLTNVVREPVQGVIALGTMPVMTTGLGSFIYPVDQANITCAYGCYFGHNGTDFQSRYDRYGNIYASDSGVVERIGYDGLSGNYCVINHNNGFWTWYGHATQFYVAIGDSVTRGQVIGQIGMTGYATGPHVHFSLFSGCPQWSCVVNPCSVLDCSGAGG